ncbi:hypothetical protein ABZX77_06620 [Streptomyces sp. NPDC004237]|uniref:hypothetical protein n=1 Tax=Streptomyces sp. NPDC004237 TaxID=3154455 RepID=UPI0033B63DC4
MLLALVLGAGSGCEAADDGSDGPLGAPVGDGTAICTPGKPGRELSFGADLLHNRSGSDVVVDKIGLADAHGLTVAHAVIVPVRNYQFGLEAWPPPESTLREPGIEWSNRQTAVGATLKPQPKADWGDDDGSAATAPASPDSTDATGTDDSDEFIHTGRQFNLVLGLRITGTSGVGTSGVVVDYHVGDRKYVWRNLTQLTIETKKSSC